MHEDEELERIGKLQNTVKEFEAVANTHKILSEEVAMLVNMKDKAIPEMIKKVQKLVGEVDGGFNLEELEKQVRDVLNKVINQSDYTKLQANIDATAKKMIDAVETSSRQVNQWRDNYQSRSRWHFILVSLVVGLGIGIGGSYYVTMKKFTQYQDVVDATSFYARYLNSSCKTKTDFAKFIGQSQKFDCNTNWISGVDYLAKKD